MLVLSRKSGEAIVIGGDIEIIVTDVGHGRVRLGISAPQDVSILRSELVSHDSIVTSDKFLRAGEWRPELDPAFAY